MKHTKYNQKKATEAQNSYYKRRITQMGINTDTAEDNGLYGRLGGSIEQRIKTFDGEDCTFTPKTKNAVNQYCKEWKKENPNHTPDQLKAAEKKYKSHLGQFIYFPRNDKQATARLTITRNTPQQVEKGSPRYHFLPKSFTGLEVKPMPSNTAIQAFRDGVKGGNTFFTEGMFKSICLSINGVEATAFTGISTYKICDQTKEYILRREQENLTAIYDGDALDYHEKNGTPSNNRLNNFAQSPINFARQFFKLKKEHELSTSLWWCMVNPLQKHKGIDDLLNAATPEKKAEILEALNSHKDSEYFLFLKLSKSNYEKKILHFFSLNNHRAFYQKYRNQIGTKDFIFDGITYTPTKCKNGFCIMKTDPHQIELNAVTIQIKKYLSEQENKLTRLFKKSNKIAIESITGSGKTSLYIGYKDDDGQFVKGYFEQRNIKGLVVVPTVFLAKQLGAETGYPVLCGHVNASRAEAAERSPVIIATYDTAHHVTDLKDRVLVVDEAHNLINQYGQINRRAKEFRAGTLIKLLRSFETAKQTILLSGTMPRMLCKALGFELIQVNRAVNPTIKIKPLEATKNSTKALTTATLKELIQIDFSKDQIHFCLFDNSAALENIKAAVVKAGVLAANEIEIITSPTIKKAENIEAYNQIIKNGIVLNKKLILSTCLLAEGISIKNKNIGQVFCVNVNCPDKFRQFIARFRNIKTVNVTSILPPETRTGFGFKDEAERQLDRKTNDALHHLKQYNQTVSYYTNKYGEDHTGERYKYNNITFEWLRISSDETAQVDILKVLASIRESIIHYSNNCYFYSQLLALDNFQLAGIEAAPKVDTTEIEQAQAAAEKETREKRKAIKERLRATIIKAPETIATAYYLHCEATGNRHGAQDIQKTAGHLLEHDNPNAALYYDLHKIEFAQSWFTKIIRAWLKLVFIGVDTATVKNEILEFNPQDFNKKWRAFQRSIDILLFKKHPRKLNTIHRADIKTHLLLKRRIAAEAGKHSGVITTAQINTILKKTFSTTRVTDNGSYQQVQTDCTRQGAAAKIIESLFMVDVEKINKYGNQYTILGEYISSEEITQSVNVNLPFAQNSKPKILCNPLKMLQLRK